MLDNDELIATRKLHGQDDGVYEETNNKNVANIKKDVRILNALINVFKAKIGRYDELLPSEVSAIENILSELKQKDKRIQELEEDLMDSIPKQVVIDKVNEINKKYEDSKDENGESPYFYPDFTIRILQELLEGRNKNVSRVV